MSGFIIILPPPHFDTIIQILTICIQTEATDLKDEVMLFSGHRFTCSFALTAVLNLIEFNVLNMLFAGTTPRNGTIFFNHRNATYERS